MTLTLITKDGRAVIYDNVVAIEHDAKEIRFMFRNGSQHTSQRAFYEEVYYVD